MNLSLSSGSLTSVCLPAPLSNYSPKSNHIFKIVTRRGSDVKIFRHLDDYNTIIFEIGNKTNNPAITNMQSSKVIASLTWFTAHKSKCVCAPLQEVKRRFVVFGYDICLYKVNISSLSHGFISMEVAGKFLLVCVSLLHVFGTKCSHFRGGSFTHKAVKSSKTERWNILISALVLALLFMVSSNPFSLWNKSSFDCALACVASENHSVLIEDYLRGFLPIFRLTI